MGGDMVYIISIDVHKKPKKRGMNCVKNNMASKKVTVK